MSRKPTAAALARKYVHMHATDARGVRLRRWRGDWYLWSAERGYAAQSEDQIDADLYRKLALAKRAEVGDVRHALLGVEHVLIDHVELGDWLDGERGHDARDVAICSNGALHLPSGELRPPTPRHFATATLGVAYDANAPAPTKWLTFLRELWPDDDESISALHEWMGYLLTPDTRQHKILLFVGPPRSGRGTIMRVMAALLGPGNVAAPSLSSLSLPFGLWPLIGRNAAIVGDARLSGRSDIAQIVERLLSISGEDPQTIDRKHREPWHGTLPIRFCVVSNMVPRFSDASDALAKRMLALRLTRTFYGREDETLTEKLLVELPGILHCAIDGWRRLRERRHFMQPTSSASMIGEVIDLASPVAAWVRARIERDVTDRGQWVLCDAAWRDFLRWCDHEGLKAIPTRTVFGSDIKAATGTDRELVSRIVEGKPFRPNAYRGLALRTDQGDQGFEHFCTDIASQFEIRNTAHPDHPDHPAGRNGHSLQLDLTSVPKPEPSGSTGGEDT